MIKSRKKIKNTVTLFVFFNYFSRKQQFNIEKKGTTTVMEHGKF